jgi:23S rRNA (uracil1939-C5)-methyltransferase
VRERLRLGPDDVLADLYAGVGFFSKLLAQDCREVVAVEVSKAAADNARRNLVGVANVQYVLGDVEKVLPFLVQRPNKVLLDPSREGCMPPAVDAILAIEPERIVYVSCDAATLARDLRRMVDGGYVVHEVQPLDMFPQTFHIECIATLTRPPGAGRAAAVDMHSGASA